MGIFLKTPLLHKVRELQVLLLGPGGDKDQAVLGVLTSRQAVQAPTHHAMSSVQLVLGHKASVRLVATVRALGFRISGEQTRHPTLEDRALSLDDQSAELC